MLDGRTSLRDAKNHSRFCATKIKCTPYISFTLEVQSQFWYRPYIVAEHHIISLTRSGHQILYIHNRNGLIFAESFLSMFLGQQEVNHRRFHCTSPHRQSLAPLTGGENMYKKYEGLQFYRKICQVVLTFFHNQHQITQRFTV